MARRVLVVDDEPSILTSTAALLRDLDFDVATCASAPDILHAMELVQPDILLQDVRMPGLDLDKLISTIRGDPRWRHVAIVIFTASMDLDEIAERLGLATVLEKPFKPQELLDALDSTRPAAPLA